MVEADDGLIFTEEFVVDADFAVRCPTYDDVFVKLWLVEVDLSSGWTTKDLELQSDTIIVKVFFEAFLYVDGLHLVFGVFMILCLLIELKVTILIDHVSLQEIDNNVCFTDIDKHVVLEIDWLLLSDEHTISHS